MLTARSLNPGLVIAARAVGDGAEQRILQAGADRVVNPYQLGGARLARLLVEPPGAQGAWSSGLPVPGGSPAPGGSSGPASGQAGVSGAASDSASLSEPGR